MDIYDFLNFGKGLYFDQGLYIYALLAANTLVLTGGLLLILRLRRLCKLHEKSLECPPAIALADADQPAAEVAEKQMLALMRMEKQLLTLRTELAAHAGTRGEVTTSSERVLPLDNAVRMAKNGASVDDLTRSCGLNIGEARLIRKMHGRADSAERLSA